MNTLFPLEYSFPPGFSYYPDFIDEKEEKDLLLYIAGIEFHSFQFQGYEAKRRVASYGYDWSFERKMLSRGKDIPSFFIPLIEKLAHKLNLSNEKIAELLVTEYPVGSVIN